MKYLILLIFFSYTFSAFAQQKDFYVTLTSTDSIKYKYAYFYTWTESSMQKRSLKQNSTAFQGSYNPITMDGIFQSALIVLSDEDLLEKDLLKNKNNPRRDFLLETNVDVVFDANNRHFNVHGCSLNKVNNIFRENEWKFAQKEDSIAATLEASYPDFALREKERKKLRRTIFLKEKDSTLQLIRENINSKVSLQNFVIYAMVPFRPVAEIRDVFNGFPNDVRTGKKGHYVDSLITVQENMFKGGLNIGNQLPDFSLQDTKDAMVKSRSHLGKYTLIDFWASWCAPCRAETPNLIAAYGKYHIKGLNIIAISIDQEKDKSKWLAAIEKDKSGSWTNLFNPGGTDNIAKELGINAIPTNYLIDSTGKIIAKNVRGQQLEQLLNKLLL